MEPGSLLAQARRRAALSQAELAARAGTSQPAVARLESGLGSPTVATLERLLAAAGFAIEPRLVPLPPARDPVVERYKADVDRSLLRENLRRSVEERLTSLVQAQRAGDALANAVRTRRRR